MVKGIISLDSLINIICEAGDKILPMRNNSNSFQISKKMINHYLQMQTY